MKATELQIGDYVFVKSKNKIGIVHELYTRTAHVRCGEVYGSVYVNRYAYDDIEPVPLTPEILEKNEFKWCNNLQKMMFYPNIKSPFIVQIKEGVVWYEAFGGDRVLNYVHELQHALHLCGLEELADNFKVQED